MADWTLLRGSPPVALPQASTGGTDCSSDGTTANTLGAWVEIEDATPEEFHGFWMSVMNFDTSARSFLVDIGIGAASSEQVILPQVFFSHGSGTAAGGSIFFFVPLLIPKGSRVAARNQCTIVSGTTRVAIHGQRPHPYWPTPCGRATTYGANTSTSAGVELDAGGTANQKGAWVEVVASTSNRINLLLVDLQVDAHTGDSYGFQLDVAVDAGSSTWVTILENIPSKQVQTGEINTPGVHGPFPVCIPAGSRIGARISCSGTVVTSRKLDIVLHGFE